MRHLDNLEKTIVRGSYRKWRNGSIDGLIFTRNHSLISYIRISRLQTGVAQSNCGGLREESRRILQTPFYSAYLSLKLSFYSFGRWIGFTWK
uniref:Uncharacterized protein n=1 Tax=Haemonchus contortus TaxID=6289 RepID=A0A7I4Z225_HAECO